MRTYDIVISCAYLFGIGEIILLFLSPNCAFYLGGPYWKSDPYLIPAIGLVLLILYFIRNIWLRRTRFSLKNKVVVITGASQGIGAAMVEQFIKQQANVVLAARSEERMQDLVTQLTTKYGHVNTLIVPTDVTKITDVEHLLSKVMDKYQRIDVLINNAGGGFLGKLQEMPFDRLKIGLELNFMSPVYVTHAVVREMMKNSGKNKGHIINVSSFGSCIIMPDIAYYNVAKRGLVLLTQAWAIDLAAVGIKVSAILPGPVQTNFQQNLVGGKYLALPGIPAKWVANNAVGLCLHGRSRTKVFDILPTRIFATFLTFIGWLSPGLLIRVYGFKGWMTHKHDNLKKTFS